jgi:hypothetical protein
MQSPQRRVSTEKPILKQRKSTQMNQPSAIAPQAMPFQSPTVNSTEVRITEAQVSSTIQDAIAPFAALLPAENCPRWLGQVTLTSIGLTLTKGDRSYPWPKQGQSLLLQLIQLLDGTQSLETLRANFAQQAPYGIDLLLLQLLDWQLIQLGDRPTLTGAEAYVQLKIQAPCPSPKTDFLAAIAANKSRAFQNYKRPLIMASPLFPGFLVELSHIIRNSQGLPNLLWNPVHTSEAAPIANQLQTKLGILKNTILTGLSHWQVTPMEIELSMPLPYTAAIYSSLLFYGRRDPLVAIAQLNRLTQSLQSILESVMSSQNSEPITPIYLQLCQLELEHLTAQRFAQESGLEAERLTAITQQLWGWDERFARFLQQLKQVYQTEFRLRKLPA